jgi:hypothetical protein
MLTNEKMEAVSSEANHAWTSANVARLGRSAAATQR